MKKSLPWVARARVLLLIVGILAGYIIIQQIIKIQSQPVTYTEPRAYSITFPKNWQLDGGGETSGYEILSLYSYNYQKVAVPGGEFSRGQIKVAISIIDKEGKSLVQIVDGKFSGAEKDFKKEIFNINGHKAFRVSGSFDTGDALSPMIETFIDYNADKYAWLVGYYSGDKKSATKINDIMESFKVIK